MARVLFWLGAAGIGLIAFGMGVEFLLQYWYVPVIAGVIWFFWKRHNVNKAWVSRYKDKRKLRFWNSDH